MRAFKSTLPHFDLTSCWCQQALLPLLPSCSDPASCWLSPSQPSFPRPVAPWWDLVMGKLDAQFIAETNKDKTNSKVLRGLGSSGETGIPLCLVWEEQCLWPEVSGWPRVRFIPDEGGEEAFPPDGRIDWVYGSWGKSTVERWENRSWSCPSALYSSVCPIPVLELSLPVMPKPQTWGMPGHQPMKVRPEEIGSSLCKRRVG